MYVRVLLCVSVLSVLRRSVLSCCALFLRVCVCVLYVTFPPDPTFFVETWAYRIAETAAKEYHMAIDSKGLLVLERLLLSELLTCGV